MEGRILVRLLGEDRDLPMTSVECVAAQPATTTATRLYDFLWSRAVVESIIFPPAPAPHRLSPSSTFHILF